VFWIHHSDTRSQPEYYFEDVVDSDAPKTFALLFMTVGAGTDDDKANFALGIGLFALFTSVVLLCIQMSRGSMDRRIEISAGVIMSVAWGLGAAFNTSSSGPFAQTDNGYFATWLALIASCYYLYQCVQTIKTVVDQEIMRQNGALALVFLASLFELSVAAEYCVDSGSCEPKYAAAIGFGVTSFLFSLFQLMFVRLGAPAGVVCGKPIALLLLLLWSLATGMNTHFGGPFSSSCQHANGYFATWIAFLAALNYAYSMLLAPSMSPYDYSGGGGESQPLSRSSKAKAYETKPLASKKGDSVSLY